MSQSPQQDIADFFDDQALQDLFIKVLKEVGPLDPNGQDFERGVRNNLVLKLTKPQANTVIQTAMRELPQCDKRDPLVMLVVFYTAFEWLHRMELETNKSEALPRWRALFSTCSYDFSNYALFHYAKSRFLLEEKDIGAALDEAASARDIAQYNVGWLNNYAEILLDWLETADLSDEALESEHASEENLERILNRFAKAEDEGAFIDPYFLSSCGRICAYRGDAKAAREWFDAAKGRALQLKREGDPWAGDEGSYIAKISELVQAQTTSEVLCSSRETVKSMQEIERRYTSSMEDLDAKVEEVSQHIENERVSMLEFLGFFSGIVSFIIASITVGSDMGFAERGALIIILLGALLVAFGSFSTLIENMRTSTPKARSLGSRGAWAMAITGLGVLVLGFVIYFVAKAIGVS